MEGKSSDWMRVPSGPTVCRCCFAEGCYKDISTEYFWMGKREVYAEMLTETFDLSIAFAQASGPNSNSRLICEPCISRLRDASEFKRQVQECEKMFLQYLDPGRAGAQEIEMEIAPEPEKEVKLERVKLEKAASDDEFDDRGGFDDMDDDDLDDQPLTKLASKVPKKESVDLLDLLDNAKAEKRKSSSKSKASPAKKSKTKKESPKASASKVKPEKKKKGQKSEEANQPKKDFPAAEDTKDSQWRTNLRNNLSLIVDMTTVYPFKYSANRQGALFLCYFCKDTFFTSTELRNHSCNQHTRVENLPKLKGYRPIKMDFTAASCKICGAKIRDYTMLKDHMAAHGHPLNTTRGDTIFPYNLGSEVHVCQICNIMFDSFVTLMRHMIVHSDRHMCNKCGKRLKSYGHLLTHINSNECGTSSGDNDLNDLDEITTFVEDTAAQKQLEEPGDAKSAVDEDVAEQKRSSFRKNILTIVTTTTVYPFRYKRGLYQCFYCDKTFLKPEELRQHNRAHHYETKVCPKFKMYEPVKMDFDEATCRLCLTQIHDYATLKTHLAEHNKNIDTTHGENVIPYDLRSDNKHVCQMCKKSYESFLSLHKHINEHFDSYICDQCGKKHKTKRQLVIHRRIHERGEFPCKKCDKSFNVLSHLFAHDAKAHRTNVAINSYKCPVCKEKFASYRVRLQHLAKAHGFKTPEFPCPSCDKVFDMSGRRTEHIKTHHLKQRNHECQLCGNKFSTQAGLKHHLVKHGGERIYQCDICKKTYARIKTLREHMRIHNDDRRFACAVCGLTFIQKCSLKHHLRVHHPTQFKQEFES